MRPGRRWSVLAIAAIALSGCASTHWNGYSEGTVKSSEIRYEYTAQPVFTDAAGKTYQIETSESLRGVTEVRELSKRGVQRATHDADIVFSVEEGAIHQEPGSFGLGGSYQPALVCSMPITIKVHDKHGRMIAHRQFKHEEVLGIQGAAKFDTREEAKAAMGSISELVSSSAEAKVRNNAPGTASKSLNLISKQLFEPRELAVTLPAIRSAGDVDMEEAYTLLANAEGEAQVKSAITAYAALGTNHRKVDGTEDVLGSYGVLCGLASAKILNGDLTGAWQDTKHAWELFPKGEEHRTIAAVLKQQEDEAGVDIIPEEDFEEMTNADMKMATDQLRKLFGGGD